MAEKKKLGDILKENGLINDNQLEAALTHQKTWGGKLGAILVELGYLKEYDLVTIMSGVLKIPHLDLFQPEIPEAVVNLIKPEIARKYAIIPVKKDVNVLMLAMADPMDIKVIDEVRFITGFTIKPTFAIQSEIQDAIRKYYDHEPITHRDSSEVLAELKTSALQDMEIMRERDTAPKADAKAAPAPTLDRVRIDALITLLVEKGLITREELGKMIEQKKIGL